MGVKIKRQGELAGWSVGSWMDRVGSAAVPRFPLRYLDAPPASSQGTFRIAERVVGRPVAPQNRAARNAQGRRRIERDTGPGSNNQSEMPIPRRDCGEKRIAGLQKAEVWSFPEAFFRLEADR